MFRSHPGRATQSRDPSFPALLLGDGAREITWYVYDAGSQRVRKVTELSSGAKKEERTYLGGFEVFRQFAGGTVSLQRESLHVMDGQQRVAMVETRTNGVAERTVRYQFGNHLGSAALELDDESQIISFEEYYPYGSTSFQSGRSLAEVSLKRYRYTGMERDEESGLEYHSARYYAPWLGRWTSCDPEMTRFPDTSPYAFASDCPIIFHDRSGLAPETRAEKQLR